MRTVNEVSKLTGVSVRTLHHYDAIGLLKPDEVTEAGYRLYDDTALNRLQSILMFRELQFSLKEIKAILDTPGFDPNEALSQQIHLLELRRKHLEELISHAREIQRKGVSEMTFDAFKTEEIDQYAAEVRERWGATQAYAEFAKKGKEKSSAEKESDAKQLMALFTELGAMRHLAPDQTEVQDKIGMLRHLITEKYYTCTREILGGLGQMYVADERMKHNIDQAGGEGTAEFIRKAIAVYCAP